MGMCVRDYNNMKEPNVGNSGTSLSVHTAYCIHVCTARNISRSFNTVDYLRTTLPNYPSRCRISQYRGCAVPAVALSNLLKLLVSHCISIPSMYVTTLSSLEDYS